MVLTNFCAIALVCYTAAVKGQTTLLLLSKSKYHLFETNLLNASAVSSIDLESTPIFASCVIRLITYEVFVSLLAVEKKASPTPYPNRSSPTTWVAF